MKMHKVEHYIANQDEIENVFNLTYPFLQERAKVKERNGWSVQQILNLFCYHLCDFIPDEYEVRFGQVEHPNGIGNNKTYPITLVEDDGSSILNIDFGYITINFNMFEDELVNFLGNDKEVLFDESIRFNRK